MEPTFRTLLNTVVGTRGGVYCDACNREIAHRLNPDHRGGKAEGEALVFATRSDGDWFIRFISCLDCGPCGDPDFMAPDEATALVTVRYVRRVAQFGITRAKRYAELKHRGTRPRLRGDE